MPTTGNPPSEDGTVTCPVGLGEMAVSLIVPVPIVTFPSVTLYVYV